MKKTLTLKRAFSFTLAIVLSFSLATYAGKDYLNTEIVSATTSEDAKKNSASISSAKDKVDELKKKQEELDKKISSTKDDLKDEKANQDAIAEQITTVQQTILALESSISELNGKISELEDDIAESEELIATKKNEIETGISDFKERIRALYVAGNGSYSDILVGATDFYDMLMKIELVKRVADHDNGMIDNLVALKAQYEADEKALEEKKSELETDKADLVSQQEEHQSQKDKLDELYAQSQAVIDQLADDEANYEANKEQVEAEQKEFEDQLAKLYKERETIKKKQEEEAAKKAQQAAEEEARKNQLANNSNNNTNSGTSSNGNSTSSEAGGNTTGQSSTNNSDYGYSDKSMFTWPVPGYYHISYGVGWRWGAYHAGIDIWSEGIRGAKICAAAAGEVILVSNTCTHDYGKNGSCGCGGGYGNYCIIDHGNGYWTLYGHSEHISVNVGDHVEQGAVLGTVGSTGYSTGPHLHFEVRLNNVAQNPENYV